MKSFPSRSSWISRTFRLAVGLVLAFAGTLVVLWWLGIHAARYEPSFYRTALAAPVAEQQKAGDELEMAVLELHNSSRREGRWQAVFTEEQINGWLASDLPEKFPELLPPGVRQPRVAIEEDVARLACRYEDASVDVVISFAIRVHLTEEPNTLALQISQLRAGMLPLPLQQFLDQITRAAKQSGITIRWSQLDGDPVALVTVPDEDPEYAYRHIWLESISLREGQLCLSGKTEETDDSAEAPQQVADEGEDSRTIQR